MDILDKNILNALNEAIASSKIIGHFQYGHNLLQTPVQINEIFSMLDTILLKVITAIDDVIPDINLAPYKEGFVDPERANLCWIELSKGYYGLILNTHKGINFRPFTEDELKDLLLTGQISSWYLVSKIQNLAYLVAVDNTNEDVTVSYFKDLIIKIINRFFSDHENDKKYHPGGKVTLENLKSIIARLQIQNTKTIVANTDISNGGINWSQSIIKTPKCEICWQSAPNLKLTAMTSTEASQILDSPYLNERADVGAFLKTTFSKYVSNESPNVFCFLGHEKLEIPYVNLNYVVESQLHGFITIVYENGDTEEIYPDTQPFLVKKGKTDISFMVVIKLDNDIVKKVSRISTTDNVLRNLYVAFSCTGVSKEF